MPEAPSASPVDRVPSLLEPGAPLVPDPGPLSPVAPPSPEPTRGVTARRSARRRWLSQSLELQLRGLAGIPQSSVADLLLDENFYVNEGLAEFYAVDPGTADLDAYVPTRSPHRLGVLSHPGVLALNSKLEETQLVTRGLFVRDRRLCLPIPLPPEDVPLEIPDVDPEDPPENMRERFERHVESPSCAGCHEAARAEA